MNLLHGWDRIYFGAINHSDKLISVIIIRPIEEQQQHIEGDKVTFTCEVNSEVLPGTWFKDGQELSGSDNLDITANGGIREIIIQRVTVEDRGYYSFEIGDKTSGGLLVVLGKNLHNNASNMVLQKKIYTYNFPQSYITVMIYSYGIYLLQKV